MKRTMACLLAVVVLVGLTGCAKQLGRRPWACPGGSCTATSECDAGCGASCDTCAAPRQLLRPADGPGYFNPGGKCKQGCAEPCEVAPSGPPTGAIAYPYYTTRGPRDFLANHPSSIGP